MWLLVVLCVHAACPSDLVGVYREASYEKCVDLGEQVYAETNITWMCVKDVSLYDPGYEEFE